MQRPRGARLRRSLAVTLGVFIITVHAWWAWTQAYQRQARNYLERDTAAAVLALGAADSIPFAAPAFSLIPAVEWAGQLGGPTALEVTEAALRWQILDARIWSRRAVIAVYAQNSKTAMASARRAIELAPQSLPILIEVAVNLSRVHEQLSAKDADLVETWAARAGKFQPRGSLSYAVATQNEVAFCALQAPSNTIAAWCRTAVALRQQCDAATAPTRAVQQYCARLTGASR